MKITDCRHGMQVKGRNTFGLTYTIVKVRDKTVDVEHRTGNKVMRGGRMVDEVFVYPRRRPSLFSPV